MAEELSEKWKSLKLTEEEEDDIIEADMPEKDKEAVGRNWLVGKLLTLKPFGKFALMGTMKLLWKLSRGVETQALEDNLFLFKFKDVRDKERVKEGCPWAFDNHLLMLQDFIGELRPEEYRWTHTQLWGRVHELPLEMRTKAMGEKIRHRIGQCISVDESLENGGCADFLRLKVEVEINKPLRRTVKIGYGKGKHVRGRISFDRLPTFCYFCGRLGHCEDECEYNEGDEVTSPGRLQYDYWLRSSPLRKGSLYDKKANSGERMKVFSEKKKASTTISDGGDGPVTTVGKNPIKKNLFPTISRETESSDKIIEVGRGDKGKSTWEDGLKVDDQTRKKKDLSKSEGASHADSFEKEAAQNLDKEISALELKIKGLKSKQMQMSEIMGKGNDDGVPYEEREDDIETTKGSVSNGAGIEPIAKKVGERSPNQNVDPTKSYTYQRDENMVLPEMIKEGSNQTTSPLSCVTTRKVGGENGKRW